MAPRGKGRTGKSRARGGDDDVRAGFSEQTRMQEQVGVGIGVKFFLLVLFCCFEK